MRGPREIDRASLGLSNAHLNSSYANVLPFALNAALNVCVCVPVQQAQSFYNNTHIMRLTLFFLALALLFAFSVGRNARAGLRNDKNIKSPPISPPPFKDTWDRYEGPGQPQKLGPAISVRLMADCCLFRLPLQALVQPHSIPRLFVHEPHGYVE